MFHQRFSYLSHCMGQVVSREVINMLSLSFSRWSCPSIISHHHHHHHCVNDDLLPGNVAAGVLYYVNDVLFPGEVAAGGGKEKTEGAKRKKIWFLMVASK